MEGAWHLYPPRATWRGGPSHTIRAVLAAPGVVAVGYRLGMLDLVPTAAEDTLVGHLGPDVLATDFDRDSVLASLGADPDRPIGEALLDQRVLAGLGTDYVSEVCFLAGLHPLAPVSAADCPALLDRARAMIRANVGRASRTTTGRTGRGASSWVHGRTTCLRCGARLRRSTLGAPTRQRELPWCPNCQPAPAPRPTGVRSEPQLE
jgi:endonuclease-8